MERVKAQYIELIKIKSILIYLYIMYGRALSRLENMCENMLENKRVTDRKSLAVCAAIAASGLTAVIFRYEYV